MVLQSLEQLGYHVYHQLLNADLLLPQFRSRIFIVALHKSLPLSGSFKFPAMPILSCVATRSCRPEYLLIPHQTCDNSAVFHQAVYFLE